jgi:hypothetical protein
MEDIVRGSAVSECLESHLKHRITGVVQRLRGGHQAAKVPTDNRAVRNCDVF